jgi:hypothetical protein
MRRRPSEAIVIAAAQAAHDTILNHPGLPDDIRAQLAVNVGTSAVGNVCKEPRGRAWALSGPAQHGAVD